MDENIINIAQKNERKNSKKLIKEFSEDEWNCISQLTLALKIPYIFSCEWQKQNSSISEVIPGIVKIMKKMNKKISNIIEEIEIPELEYIEEFRKIFLENLHSRFDFIFEREEFLIGTLLDCRFKGKFFSLEKVDEIRSKINTLLEEYEKNNCFLKSIEKIEMNMINMPIKNVWIFVFIFSNIISLTKSKTMIW